MYDSSHQSTSPQRFFFSSIQNRWQKFFKSRFLQSLGNQANLYFAGFLIILVLLFLGMYSRHNGYLVIVGTVIHSHLFFFTDSIREMRKYSASREAEIEHGHLDSELQFSMKLFRAQRNFYVSGFALFLCLVIRRLVLLIQTQAQLIADKEASIQQAKNASSAAQSMLSSSGSSSGDKSASSSSSAGKDEAENLKKQLKESNSKCSKLEASEEALKKQASQLTAEYDRLMKEHSKVQEKYEKLLNSQDTRKDR